MKVEARYLDSQFQTMYAEKDGVPFDVLFIGKYKYVLDRDDLENREELIYDAEKNEYKLIKKANNELYSL